MSLLFQSLVTGYGIAIGSGIVLAGIHGPITGALVAWLGGGVLSLAIASLRYAMLSADTVDAMILRADDGPAPAMREPMQDRPRAAARDEAEFARWDMDLEDEQETAAAAREFEHRPSLHKPARRTG